MTRPRDEDTDRDDEYLWDGTGEPDAEIARLEKVLGAVRYEEPFRGSRPPNARPMTRPQKPWRGYAMVAAGIAVAAGVVFLLWPRAAIEPQPVARHEATCAGDDPARAWRVEAIEGTPQCAGKPLAGESRLGAGSWLETDAHARVEIDVADIGQLVVAPQSRLRLLATSKHEHRVQLTRGRIDAAVDAPPRLFVVETPSATAIDLGCAYSLEVDEQGNGKLAVTSGFVELARGDSIVLVPRGAECTLRAGVGPGTPYWSSSASDLVTALAHIDAAGGDPAPADLAALRAAAEPRDSLSLFHLFARSSPATRAELYPILAAVVAPPASIEQAALLAGDRTALSRWREAFEAMWMSAGSGQKQKLKKKSGN